jgi:hypothetical protein
MVEFQFVHSTGRITVNDGDVRTDFYHVIPQAAELSQVLAFVKWAYANKDAIWDSWVKEDVVQLQADAFKPPNRYTKFDWEQRAITGADDYPEYTGCTGKTAELIYNIPIQERVWEFRAPVPRESKFATAVYLYFADVYSPYEQLHNVEEAAKAELFGRVSYALVVAESAAHGLCVSLTVFDKDDNAVPDFRLNQVPIEDAITQVKAWETQGE